MKYITAVTVSYVVDFCCLTKLDGSLQCLLTSATAVMHSCISTRALCDTHVNEWQLTANFFVVRSRFSCSGHRISYL